MSIRIILICQKCGKKMVLTNGRYSSYYLCQNYFKEFRDSEKKVCTNRVSLSDVKLIKEKILFLIKTGELSPGISFTVAHLHVIVHTVTQDYVTVYVKNTRKRQKKEKFYYV